MIDFLHNQEPNTTDNNSQVDSKPEADLKVRKNGTGWLRKLLKPLKRKEESKEQQEINLLQQNNPDPKKTQNETDNSLKNKKNNISNNKKSVEDIKSLTNESRGKVIQEKTVGKEVPVKKIKEEYRKGGFDVNLLPFNTSYKSTKELGMWLLLGFIGAIVVIGLGYVAIFAYSQGASQDALTLQQDINQLDSQIGSYKKVLAEAGVLQVKLDAIDKILQSHVYWTNFFTGLEEATLPNVYYQGFTASIVSPQINLISYADSFRDIARQMQAYDMNTEFLAGYEVAQARFEDDKGINYNLKAVINKKVFYDQEFLSQEK